MRGTALAGIMGIVAFLAADNLAAQDRTPAKLLFGGVAAPADMEIRSIGFYAKGCLAGAKPLPVDGIYWQAMRLSRNRYWGTPQLVSYIERLAIDAHDLDGWPGLLVGDMSQPRGGPMKSGHSSHQIGLDVDIWFDPMPDRILSAEERETISATSLLKPGTHVVIDHKRVPPGLLKFLRRAASYPEVERIFVNPGIKKMLCDWAGKDRAWLRKIRPYYKHDDHLHVRLFCPPGQAACKAQDPVPPGDGCGENLAWWLGPAPWKPPPKPKKPVKPAPEMTLAALPPACVQVLKAKAPAQEAMIGVPAPDAASAAPLSLSPGAN